MKSFGELQIGDKVYSLNHNEWGVLTEHTVTDIKRNDFRSEIIIKGYLKHQIIGDSNSDKADLEIFALNKSTIGEVAPSIEGVKQYWINEVEIRIKNIKEKIQNLNNFLQRELNSLNKIKNI